MTRRRIETALAVAGGLVFTCISLGRGEAEQASIFALLTGYFLSDLLRSEA